MCDALGIRTEDLPFVGELIQIKETEQAKRQGAIERVLHSIDAKIPEITGLRTLRIEEYLKERAAYIKKQEKALEKALSGEKPRTRRKKEPDTAQGSLFAERRPRIFITCRKRSGIRWCWMRSRRSLRKRIPTRTGSWM